MKSYIKRGSCSFLTLGFIILFATGIAQSQPETVIAGMKTVNDTVEITISTSEEFYVGAMPYVLQIGNEKIVYSRHPENGDLETLIFSLPLEKFRQLKTGDPVYLGYGRVKKVPSIKAQGKQVDLKQRDLGGLDKELLDKPLRKAP